MFIMILLVMMIQITICQDKVDNTWWQNQYQRTQIIQHQINIGYAFEAVIPDFYQNYQNMQLLYPLRIQNGDTQYRLCSLSKKGGSQFNAMSQYKYELGANQDKNNNSSSELTDTAGTVIKKLNVSGKIDYFKSQMPFYKTMDQAYQNEIKDVEVIDTVIFQLFQDSQQTVHQKEKLSSNNNNYLVSLTRRTINPKPKRQFTVLFTQIKSANASTSQQNLMKEVCSQKINQLNQQQTDFRLVGFQKQQTQTQTVHQEPQPQPQSHYYINQIIYSNKRVLNIKCNLQTKTSQINIIFEVNQSDTIQVNVNDSDDIIYVSHQQLQNIQEEEVNQLSQIITKKSILIYHHGVSKRFDYKIFPEGEVDTLIGLKLFKTLPSENQQIKIDSFIGLSKKKGLFLSTDNKQVIITLIDKKNCNNFLEIDNLILLTCDNLLISLNVTILKSCLKYKQTTDIQNSTNCFIRINKNKRLFISKLIQYRLVDYMIKTINYNPITTSIVLTGAQQYEVFYVKRDKDNNAYLVRRSTFVLKPHLLSRVLQVIDTNMKMQTVVFTQKNKVFIGTEQHPSNVISCRTNQLSSFDNELRGKFQTEIKVQGLCQSREKIKMVNGTLKSSNMCRTIVPLKLRITGFKQDFEKIWIGIISSGIALSLIIIIYILVHKLKICKKKAQIQGSRQVFVEEKTQENTSQNV